MSKDKEAQSPQDKSGTPTSLLISLAATIVVFAIAEIQNTLTLGETFAMRYTLMGYVALGLALAFFWKRYERSPFLKISSGLFLFGLWLSLFMTTLAPLLLRGESPIIQAQVMQQVGLGFVAASALSLVAALFQGQKAGASLVLSALGAIALFVTSGAGFLVRPQGPNEGLISANDKGHPAKEGHGEEGEEISAHGHGSAMSAKAPSKDGHGEEGDAHGTHEEGGQEEAHAKPAGHGSDAHGTASAHGEEVDAHDEEGHSKKPAESAEHHAAKHEENAHSKKSNNHDKKAGSHAHDAGEHVSKKAVAKKSAPVASLDHAVAAETGHDHEPKAKAHGISKKTAKVVEKKAGHDAHSVHWSYAPGNESPEHWGELADNFRTCSVGQTQSPIDIPSAWPSMSDISLDYKLTPVSIVDNGHTIQFNVGEQNNARIAGKNYKLVQFHIHSPSEHWLNGRSTPLEIHFVHKDEKGNLAVLGVFVEQGAEQKVFQDMWTYIPQGINVPASPRDKVFNIASLIPPKLKVYRYRGSLTTPPCSENVLWSVATDSITMSKEQIDGFRVRYKNNARPVQKRAGYAH